MRSLERSNLMEFALCHFFNGFVRRVDDFNDSIFIARLELSVDISEVVPIKSYLLASDFRKQDEDRVRAFECLDRKYDGEQVD